MALIHTFVKKADVYTLSVSQITTYVLNKICGTRKTKITEFILEAEQFDIIDFVDDGKYELVLSAVGEADVVIPINIYNNLLKSMLIDIESFLEDNCNTKSSCTNTCTSKDAQQVLQYKNLFVKLLTFQALYFDSIVENLSLAFNTFISDSVSANRCSFQNNINKILKDECLHGSSGGLNNSLFTEFVSLFYYATYFIERNLVTGDLEQLTYLEEKFNTDTIINYITSETCLQEDQVENIFANALNAVNTPPTIDNFVLTPNNNLPNNLYQHTFTLAAFTNNFADVQGDLAKDVKFSILPVRGLFTFNGNPVQIGIDYPLSDVGLFNYSVTIDEQKNIFDIIVFQVSDNNAIKLYSEMANITINTAGYVNQPISQLGDLVLNKDNRENHVFTINDFTTSLNPPYVDPEGDTLDAIRVDTLPLSGQLQLSGNPVSVNDIIPATQINSGNFIFISPNADASGISTATFSARDSGSLQWVS